MTETTNAGYTLSDITCTGPTNSTVVIGAAGGFNAGDTSVDVTLADGESVTCTYTNDLLGALTIIKDVNPEPDATDFAFTATGAGLTNFSLDDDAADTGHLGDTKNRSPSATWPSAATAHVTEDDEHRLQPGGHLTAPATTAGVIGDNTRRPASVTIDQSGRRRGGDLHLHQRPAGLDHDHQGRQPRARRDRLRLHRHRHRAERLQPR